MCLLIKAEPWGINEPRGFRVTPCFLLAKQNRTKGMKETNKVKTEQRETDRPKFDDGPQKRILFFRHWS